MVIDTSALLAVIFNEEHGPWVLDQLINNQTELRMSAVNFSETLVLIRDRQPQHFELIKEKLTTFGIRFVAADEQHAELAAEARVCYPINLGDCFAYALAKLESCPILTLDRDFKKTDLVCVMPM